VAEWPTYKTWLYLHAPGACQNSDKKQKFAQIRVKNFCVENNGKVNVMLSLRGYFIINTRLLQAYTKYH
jgi:hypothetical protein